MSVVVSEYGGYLVDGEVGRGGHATVYRAGRAGAPRPAVALKVLDAAHRTPGGQDRLRREFEVAHALTHPHIVTMYEHGPHWLAMELLDGGDAADLPTVTDRLTALAQIADALDYTHHSGVVHCDVKPANILMSPRGRAVLIDFGVAHPVVDDVWRRQRRPEVSLPYTAPEVLVGRAPSAASDQYALACTAVELLTGRPPFTGASAVDLIDAHLHRTPPALSRVLDWLPRSFDIVLGRAIAKLPESRYDSCTEFVANLTRVLTAG